MTSLSRGRNRWTSRCAILAVVSFGISTAHAGINDGLAAYWGFDDPGDVGRDESGQGHDLTLDTFGVSEGPTLITGRVGPHALFISDCADSGGYAWTDNATNLQLNASYTVATWIRRDCDESQGIALQLHFCTLDNDGSWSVRFWQGDGDVIEFIEHFAGTGQASVYGVNGACYRGGPWDHSWGDLGVDPSLVAGEWAHIAFTYDHVATQASVYVNGQLIRSGDWTSEVGGSLADFSLGSSHRMNDLGGACPVGAGYYFPGAFDELRLYNRALEPMEVAILAGVPIPTVSTWGVVAMALLVLTAGTIVHVRRSAAWV